ncbi:NRDE family protein [Pigmentiphaga sp.]|uniref:NRDE family protein n=1 Tax=Pigmentiphaga sp. TaxID=1977564 RepID=UPI0025FC9A3F|nr:NRDE family protein [Pigmentiphaga sp.]MBX6319670.1 NRDE family protein [Pigmentiphaga sp.]
MCLIAFAWDPRGPTTLLFVANRDEFYARPTAPADWWPDLPDIWAGRDLAAGGTWMGITRQGRFAAITNYREAGRHDPHAPSRGKLVTDFLAADCSPAAYLRQLSKRAEPYNGFNLLVGDLFARTPSLWYLSHRRGYPATPPEALTAGVYGLSNAMLDTPWPKVVRTTAALATLKAADARTPAYLQMLSDTTIADDAELPSTGISIERERALSAAFIVTPDYGTRAQTVLQVTRDGRVEASERSFENAEQARRLAPAAWRQVTFAVPNTERR